MLALCAGVCFIHLGSPLGLHQNDEDYYLGVARSMYDSGDWAVPHWGGQPTFVKPPLLYWLMAASMRLFGPNLWAARLPVALLGIGLAWMTFALARRLLQSELGGLLAAYLTFTTVGFLQYARVAMMDVPLAFCLVVAVWATWRIGQGNATACYAFFGAVAASVLLKGPAAALVPLGGLSAWLVAGRWVGKARPAPRWAHLAGGAGLGLALVAAWPLALAQQGMFNAFYREFIVGENLGKFAGPRNPLAGMLAGFAALLLPWTLLLLAALWLFLRSPRERDVSSTLTLCFVLANTVVYALPAIKWPQYLLPSIPLQAIFVAWAVIGPLTSTGSSAEQPSPYAPFAVLRPMRLAVAASGSVLLCVAPFIAIGSRLFPAWTERGLLFGLALSVAFSGLCLLSGSRLVAGAASFSVVLMLASGVAPVLSLERLPPEVPSLVAGHDVMTYGVPPYGYQLMLGRSVGVTDRPNVFREQFPRGVLFIVGDSELSQLSRSGALDPGHARVLACWRKWRRHMNVGEIVRTIFSGQLDDLTEDVSLIERRAQ